MGTHSGAERVSEELIHTLRCSQRGSGGEGLSSHTKPEVTKPLSGSDLYKPLHVRTQVKEKLQSGWGGPTTGATVSRFCF